MVEVYFYMPASKAGNAVDCGIKLSEWNSREVTIGGESRKCICALLNPRDNMEKYISNEYKCIKMEVEPKYCYIAEGALYPIALINSEVMELYDKSKIPVDQYKFGYFRHPECLVAATVISEHVSILDKRLDSPVLFNSSGELYLGNIIAGFSEEYEDFNDSLLFYFFSHLVELGACRRIGSDGIMEVFMDKSDNKIYTIKVPEPEKFR